MRLQWYYIKYLDESDGIEKNTAMVIHTKNLLLLKFFVR